MSDSNTAPPRYSTVAGPEVATAPALPPSPPPPPPPAPAPAPPPLNGEAQLGYNYQHELMAKCARGEHQLSKRYGVVGIICSIACFPCGLFALLCDNTEKCDRCGLVVG